MNETFWEKEKEKRKSEKKEEEKDNSEKMKRLEKLLLRNNIKISLEELKKLIKDNFLDMDIVEKYFGEENLGEAEITEIFEKIEEIEEIKNIDEIIPKEFRIDKAEYLLALQNAVSREDVKKKLDDILSHIALKFQSSKVKFGLMFFYISTLEKNLIKIQGNTIDMKNFLDKNPI